MKFGIVGVIAFIIDWGILNILVGAFHMHNVLAATISFIISLIFNYVASMKMVFKHREDMARWMEIVIFVVGAVIGLFMNDAIIWISTYGMNHDAYVSQSAEYLIRTNVGKLIATAVVMVWNFVTRKWLLDDTHTNATNRLKKKKPPDSGTAGSQVGEQLLAQAGRLVAGAHAEGLAEVAGGVSYTAYEKARPNRIFIAIRTRLSAVGVRFLGLPARLYGSRTHVGKRRLFGGFFDPA